MAKFWYPRNQKDGAIMWPSKLNSMFLLFDTMPDDISPRLRPHFAMRRAVKRVLEGRIKGNKQKRHHSAISGGQMPFLTPVDGVKKAKANRNTNIDKIFVFC